MSAYLAQLGALTDELIANASPDPNQPSPRRDAVIRTLRNHSHVRINQFEVDGKLHGLVERFRVTGREALGDALAKRFDALDPLRTKWTPEILYLLLELSDHPAENSRLESLGEPEDMPGPRLNWRDIAKEDGWNEDGDLWRNVSFADNSDDDYEYDQEQTGTSENESDDTSISSPQGLEMLVEHADDHHLLRRIAESQPWRSTPPENSSAGRIKKTPLSELQILREVLFMLGGLDTNLFDSRHGPVLNYQLVDICWDTHKALVTSFAEHGRTLAPLRIFSATKQTIPLMQVFHQSIQESLGKLDDQLAHLQRRFAVLKADVIVSLMQLSTELKAVLAALYELSSIVQQVQQEPNMHAFHYLELLFDAASLAQMTGNDATYQLLGTMFFDCFKVYLRSIRAWMEDGELLPGDRTFFVSQSLSKTPLHDIWQHQFKLLTTQDGALHAPKFLQPAIQRIFATGKSIVVLKELGRHESAKKQWKAEEAAMEFATICEGDVAFAPFAEVFNDAFDRWIESKHHTASATLRELLFRSYGLSASLSALQCIYLTSGGSREAESFSSAFFRQLDCLGSGWRDRFVLSEMCQEAYTSIETFRLSAKLDPQSLVQSAVASRSSVRLSLPAVRIHYRLDWPVRIIVPGDAVCGYQAVFTFLLQIRRAMSTLHRRHVSVAGVSHDLHGADGPYYLLRTKLLWFCNNVMSYLTTLVIAPNISALRETLRCAVDMDDMIKGHAAFMDRLREECCLGTRLQPIRECMLDVLDLSIKLEDAHDAERIARADEEQETSRLSAASSPYRVPPRTGDEKKIRAARSSQERSSQDSDGDDDMDPDRVGILRNTVGDGAGKSYAQVLEDIHVDFERHLRFVAGGLRGVARASRNEAGAKWDLLAEMLEVGTRSRDLVRFGRRA